MEKMSGLNERRLLKALDKAAELSKEDSSPNSIMIKVAREYNLNPNEIARVVETFNKAKTVAYLKKASEEVRAEDFPIASTEEVLKDLYSIPNKEASLIEIKKVNYVNSYVNDTMEKAASVVEKKSLIPEYEGTLIKQAEELKAIADKMSHLLQARKTKYLYKMAELVNDIVYECESLSEDKLYKFAKDIVNSLGEEKGNKIIGFIQKGLSRTKLPDNLKKNAYAVIFPKDKIYDKLSELIDCFTKSANAVKDLEVFNKEARGDMMTPFDLMMERALPFYVDQDVKAPGVDPETGFMKKELSNTIKNIKAKSLLSNLYLFDPVIRNYPFTDVKHAFNELRKIAPALQDVEWMKGNLRRYLGQNQQLTPFEYKDILGANKDRLSSISETIQSQKNLLNTEHK